MNIANSSGTSKLVGKKITFSEGSTPGSSEVAYDIIIFDYSLTSNVRGTCNLGLIKDIDQLVAIKKIENKKPLTHVAGFEQFRNRYKNELENMYEASKRSRMSFHPNIVQVFPIACYSTNKTHAYIVMEFCKGGTLDAEISIRSMHGKWFTLRQLSSIIKQLINGYDQLHRCQILHQNLSSSSIFINEGYVKIGSFGSSCKLNKHTPSNKIQGCLYYTAPEKYKPDYLPSPASDIFSLGVLFYELMFKDHPYFNSKIQDFFKGSFSLKELVQRKYKQADMLVEEIEKGQIKRNLESYIACENKEQAQSFNKILSVVLRMLEKKPESRIKFQEILLAFSQLLAYEVEPISFINTRAIPAKLNYIIESESKIEKKSLNFEPLELADIKKIHPQLYSIRYESERINLLSGLLFSITKRLEIQIEANRIGDIQITATKQKLLEFNFCLTYHKYSEILKQIAGLENEIRKSYYRTGIDCIVNNTKVNEEFLLNQIMASGEVCRLEEIIELAEATPECIFKDMQSFLKETLVNSRKDIDPTNDNCYMILSLLLQFVLDMGWNFATEEIEQLIKKFKEMELQLGKFNLSRILERLSRYGITFSIIQERD